VKIADALADAHRLGVLHRDVKPANILVSGFGEPALADFGLAVLTETRDLSIMMDVLTPAYAPREMLRPGCQPSPVADVYALCATLYALLRGRPPRWYDDRDPSLVELLDLFDVPIPDLPDVPVDLLDVLRAGMANDADQRPSAAQVRDRLAGLPVQPAPIPAEDAVRVAPEPISRPDAWSMLTQRRPDGPTSDLSAPASDKAPEPPDGKPDGKKGIARIRNRWPFIGAGVAVLLLGLLVTGVWYGLGQSPAHRVLLAGIPHRPTRPTSGASQPAIGIGSCMLTGTGASCPTNPECFDTLTVTAGVARAGTLPCTRPHTWEVFALGQLPRDAPSIGYPQVKNHQNVVRVCNRVTLILAEIDVREWMVDVLPPSPEAFARGDRTFRCLAGTGPDGQTTPTFAR
jgi:hypothetical protein